MRKTDFERENYQELCAEMREILRQEKELAISKEALKNKLIEMSGGDRMEYGIKITYRSSKGSVDFERIAKKAYTDEEISQFAEEFRKPNREYWEVRSY